MTVSMITYYRVVLKSSLASIVNYHRDNLFSVKRNCLASLIWTVLHPFNYDLKGEEELKLSGRNASASALGWDFQLQH